jgi:hypothetical protein
MTCRRPVRKNSAYRPELLPEPTPRAGWCPRPWCDVVGFSDQQLFLLWRRGEGPYFVRLGPRLTIVTESPQAFLARMAEITRASPANKADRGGTANPVIRKR